MGTGLIMNSQLSTVRTEDEKEQVDTDFPLPAAQHTVAVHMREAVSTTGLLRIVLLRCRTWLPGVVNQQSV